MKDFLEEIGINNVQTLNLDKMSYLLMTEEQALELNGYQVGVNVFNAAKIKDSELYAVYSNAKNEFPELDLSEFEGVEYVEFYTEDEGGV